MIKNLKYSEIIYVAGGRSLSDVANLVESFRNTCIDALSMAATAVTIASIYTKEADVVIIPIGQRNYEFTRRAVMFSWAIVGGFMGAAISNSWRSLPEKLIVVSG